MIPNRRTKRMKVILFLLVFFTIGALFIISNNNIPLNNSENITQLSETYLNWLDKIFSNTQDITGEVIGLEWLP